MTKKEINRRYYLKHKAKHNAWCKEYNKTYEDTTVNDRVHKYAHTVKGYLRGLHRHMTERCVKQNSYVNIENRFTSDEFLDYVMNILQIDPRGLDCHRIDNEGHYEPGNIEFITEEEHVARHREIRLIQQ